MNTVPLFSCFDFKNNFILAVGEEGQGKILHVKFMDAPADGILPRDFNRKLLSKP
jgi:hypothetical protein